MKKNLFCSIFTVVLSVAISAISLPVSALTETPNELYTSVQSVFQTGEYDILLQDIPEPVYTDEIYTAPSQTEVAIQLGSYFGDNTYDFYKLLSSSQKTIYKQMLAVLKSDPGAESCTVSGKNDTDIYRAFVALVMDCPEYVGLSSLQMSYSSVSSDSLVTFKYCPGQSAGSVAVNSYNMVQSEVTKLVNASSAYTTNYARLKYFAYYLCDNVTYNTKAAHGEVTGENCWNAYGALINGEGVCESYAEAFKLLCDAINVPCILVVSDTHEWNAVYMDGAWYYVDVTWMDAYATTGMYYDDWFMTGTDFADDSAHVQSSQAVLGITGFLTYPAISAEPYDPTSDSTIPAVNGLSFTGHYSDEGWISPTGSGETSGNASNAHRLEAMKITVGGYPYSGGITYRSHVQDIGWMDWVSDGDVSGTTGQCKKIEAFDVKLTGELANYYDVKYRVYVEGLGWTSWVKNGATAGTTGQNRKVFSVEMKIEPKSASSGELAFTGHYSDEGWISPTGSGETSGNASNAHRLEAMKITVGGYPYSGGITYRSHVQDIGWMDWVSDGNVSGTTGQCKKIEAFDVKLTGELANYYDVKYRVYVEGLGWTSWVKNGASAGTTGQNRKVFSVEMKIEPKSASSGELAFTGHYSDEGWISPTGSGETSGNASNAHRLEAMKITVGGYPYSGGITYRSHVQDIGWMDWVSDGDVSGTTGQCKKIEAFDVKLTGELANYYDVKYRVYVEGLGWTSWVKNGATAGTTGQNRKVFSVEMEIEKK